MIKDFFGRCKYIIKNTIYKFKGHEKRNTIAHIAKEFGCGRQSFVAKEFNIGRDTLRKGMHEIKSGINWAFFKRWKKQNESRSCGS